MVVSAYSLLMIRNDLSASDFQFASITLGVTGLFGAVAIYLSTRYREEKVVYIGQKSLEVIVDQTTMVK
jgi:hypothetical protein